MSTWNIITIENPGTLTADTMPEALQGYGSIWEEFDVTDERLDDNRYPSMPYVGKPEGSIEIVGGSKYHADDAQEAILALATDGRTITWYESWDDDGGGKTVRVFRDGAEQDDEGQHDDMVPNNLDDLIKAVREAIDSKVISTWGDGEPPRHPVNDAALALCNALRPAPVVVQ